MKKIFRFVFVCVLCIIREIHWAVLILFIQFLLLLFVIFFFCSLKHKYHPTKTPTRPCILAIFWACIVCCIQTDIINNTRSSPSRIYAFTTYFLIDSWWVVKFCNCYYCYCCCYFDSLALLFRFVQAHFALVLCRIRGGRSQCIQSCNAVWTHFSRLIIAISQQFYWVFFFYFSLAFVCRNRCYVVHTRPLNDMKMWTL